MHEESNGRSEHPALVELGTVLEELESKRRQEVELECWLAEEGVAVAETHEGYKVDVLDLEELADSEDRSQPLRLTLDVSWRQALAIVDRLEELETDLAADLAELAPHEES